MLAFFKYFHFFVDSFIESFSWFGLQLNQPTLQIILPVGISFYTFQTLSYSIDIYRGQLKPAKEPVAFFAFVAFFPQLVAGPIERASHLLPQFYQERKFSYPFAVSGLRLMLWGFFKKVVIADNLSRMVDIVYAAPTEYHGLQVVLAATFFTLQVYGDFSGYSDIAIGLSRIFGFDLQSNFKTPFFSRTIAEFWNRWHISLNTWFRDYLYIPLGGSRVSTFRRHLNTLTIFFISGLWHGASWAFVIWGILNGFYLVFAIQTKSWREKWNNKLGYTDQTRLKRVVDSLLVTFLFGLGLLIFRSNSIQDAWSLLTQIPQGLIHQLTHIDAFVDVVFSLFRSKSELVILTVTTLMMLVIDGYIGKTSISQLLDKWNRTQRWSFYFVIVTSLVLFGAFSKPESFVYFQF